MFTDEDGYSELGADRSHTFWNCNVCAAQNSCLDGECQFCDCGGLNCKRDSCSGSGCGQCMDAAELVLAQGGAA